MLTYTIPTDNVPKMVKRLKALARRAERLNFPAPSWTVADAKVAGGFETNPDGSERRVWLSKTKVTVEGEGPVLDGGWRLMAVIESAMEEFPPLPERLPNQTRNLVLTVPGVEGFEAAEYLTVPMSRCDHCHTERRRAALFVVGDLFGEHFVVGRTCLKDFTGHESPGSIVAWAEMWSEVNQMSDFEEFEAGRGISDYLDLPQYLANVAACIRVDGWTSKASAEARCIASTSADAQLLQTKARTEEEKTWQAERRPNDADRATAESSTVWAARLEGRLSDFEENIKTIASAGYVKAKRTGLAAAIVFSCLRQSEELKRIEKAAAESEYLGKVKERYTWTATYTGMSSFEGSYGPVYLCRFLVEGSEVVWWASRNPELECGQEVTLTGTLKGHDLYRGVRQTTLTRCKIA